MNHSNTKPGFSLLMMKLKAFSCILFLVVSAAGFSQNKVSGIVKNTENKKIAGVEVFIDASNQKTITNKEGFFEFKNVKTGNHKFVFFAENYFFSEQTVAVTEGSNDVAVVLSPMNVTLSEVVIKKQKEKIFALRRLKDIEETAIYAGKKTEVISMDKLTVNKATNNARQVYSQVVGLTINESNDGGLQLSIGGRGLDPNRTANFNTRQNGYDISADVLGYPESYYATPTEALEEIQIVRGAASLQYGTQFGGMVNFKLKSPSKKTVDFTNRLTAGSYGLFTSFSSLSGTVGKFSYYTFYNYKQGNGFRPNSEFDSKNYFANLNYQFTDKTSVHFDYTHFNYLAHQAGGLTDVMFLENPKQSNRTRNWFDVNWNLFALRLKHKFDHDADFSLQLFGLDASRKAVGFRENRVNTQDVPGAERDLIVGDFVNWGAEARYLKRYSIKENSSAFLIGAKYYQSKNSSIQGPGSSGADADFNLATDEFPNYKSQSDFSFPNLNVAIFGENIFKLTPGFSLTPGFRYENIRTQANGYYRNIVSNQTGVILDETKFEDRSVNRDFFLFGLGMSYKPFKDTEIYGNLSQNYRSVTFNDIRTVSPSNIIDENIKDEKGYTSDIGIRGRIDDKLTFDASVYGLYYDDKIGEYPKAIPAIVRYRSNIGTALTYGFEALVDWNIQKTFFQDKVDFIWKLYSNVAFTDSKYLKSDVPNIKGKKVEFVPLYNIKTGTGLGYKNFMTSLQFTYLSSQFTDASNNPTNVNDGVYGIFGQIPSYYVVDLSMSYKWWKWKLEAGINNLTDKSYFTRRATGYPGPGIIPSDPRYIYTTLEFVF